MYPPMRGRDGIAQALMANVQSANAPPVADNNIVAAMGAAQGMGQGQGMPQGGTPPQGNPGQPGVSGVGLGMTPPGQLPPTMNPQNALGAGMPQIPQMPQPTMPMPGQDPRGGGGY